MFCKFCGKNIPSTNKVCPSCGKRLTEVTRTVQQQVQMVSVQSEKNLGVGLALAFLFGPLGLLYASVRWACILIAIDVISLMVSCASLVGGAANANHNESVAVASVMFGSIMFWIVPLIIWIGSMILAWYSISEYNDNVRRGIANSDIN